jgi:hypothetical protein
MLKPGSTVWDLFGAVQISGYGGGSSGHSLVDGLQLGISQPISGGGGGSCAQRGEFVRAECRDGPGGQRK